MNYKRMSKEEILNYSRRIEEAFKKHRLEPKRVFGKGFKAIFSGELERSKETSEKDSY